MTHDHGDHAGAAEAMRARGGRPQVAAARWAGGVVIGDGDAVGPLTRLATPGHATTTSRSSSVTSAFTGDAVLAESSVFVRPTRLLRGYLGGATSACGRSISRCCARATAPPVAPTGRACWTRYLAHRRDREGAVGRGA